MKTIVLFLFSLFGSVAGAAELPDFQTVTHLPQYRRVFEYQAQDGAVDSLELMPGQDDCILTSSNNPYGDRSIRVTNFKTGKLQWSFERKVQGSGTIKAYSSPSGRYVVSGDQKDRVYIIDAKTGVEVDEFTVPDELNWGPVSVTFSADERYLYVGWEQNITIYDREKKQLVKRLDSLQNNAFVQLHLLGDGRLVAADLVNSVRIWKNPLESNESTEVFAKLDRGSSSLVLSGPFLRTRYMSLEDAFSIRMVDVFSGDVVQSFVGHSSMPWAVSFFNEGSVMASVGVEGVLRLWETRSGRELASYSFGSSATSYPLQARGLAVVDDGKTLLVGRADGRVLVFKVAP